MIKERNYDISSSPAQAPLKLQWPFRFYLLGKRNKPFYSPHQPVIDSRLFPKESMTMGEATPKRADSSWLSTSYTSSSYGNVSFSLKEPLGRTAHCPLHFLPLLMDQRCNIWINQKTTVIALLRQQRYSPSSPPYIPRARIHNQMGLAGEHSVLQCVGRR